MASLNNTISQETLKEFLHYDPLTGIFTWIKRNSNCIKIGDIAGCIDVYGYLLIGIKGKLYRAHRLAFLYMDGKFPTEQSDHINHVRSDNRWVNIRYVTQKENGKNQKKGKNNKSGVTGVHWDKSKNKWCAGIKIDHKYKHLGYHSNWFEAVCIRKSADHKYGFHENHGK